MTYRDEPTPAPSCPICGTNEDVAKEHALPLGLRWYCTGPCGATVFSGGDAEWRWHAKDRERLKNRRELGV